MAESSAVPIHHLDDGREFITRLDCVQYPEVAAFVKRFNNYWREAELPLDGFVGPTPEEREKLYAN